MSRPASEEKKCQWEERIRRQCESHLSIEKWCRQNQLSPHTFRYWKGRLSPKSPLTRSCFTELTLATRTTEVSIEYKGLHIHFSQGFDANTFKSCLAVLREWPC